MSARTLSYSKLYYFHRKNHIRLVKELSKIKLHWLKRVKTDFIQSLSWSEKELTSVLICSEVTESFEKRTVSRKS